MKKICVFMILASLLSGCLSGLGKNANPKIVEIGDWNMTAYDAVNVAHGLGADWKKIRSVNIVIRNDDDSVYYELGASETSATQLWIKYFNSTDIRINRTRDGFFDNNVDFDDNINRGWVTIWCMK